MKDGFYGFSWTTLFFGCFPALFRKDFLTFIAGFFVLAGVALITAGIGAIFAFFIWAFIYNTYYTKRLLENGYEFDGFPHENEQAAKALGVVLPTTSQPNPERSSPEIASFAKDQVSIAKDQRSLDNGAYKIYLVKKYKIEFNDILKQYIFNNELFNTVDLALEAAHKEEESFDVNNVELESYTWSISEAKEHLESLGFEVTIENNNYKVRNRTLTRFFWNDEELIAFVKIIKK